MMKKIRGLTAARAEALAAYHAIAHTANQAQLREASDAVEKAQRDLMSGITEGAKPCPRCNNPPIGMEQPHSKGGMMTFEVGCIHCKPFLHTDGTLRFARVAGGLMPKHSVELWNEGPDFWQIVPPNKEEQVKALHREEAAKDAHKASEKAIADEKAAATAALAQAETAQLETAEPEVPT